MMRVGIVVQRWHETVVGGAESHAWQWANLLHHAYKVDLLTTTALDASTWANALPAGKETRGGITVIRFNVDQGRTPYWHGLHRILLENRRIHSKVVGDGYSGLQIGWPIAFQEEFIYQQGPYSKGLVDFLAEHSTQYDAVIFLTYLFPTTFYGIRATPGEKCLLVPTLHDEAPAYLEAYRFMARKVRKVLWNTQTELSLGKSLWGELPGELVGMWICDKEYQPYSPGYQYLLYCGRIDPFKGIPELLDFFGRFKRETHSDIRLILTGKDEIGLEKELDIEYRGFVSEEDKFRLMAGATAFVMPSQHESLSAVTLEAMAQRTPVLVNAQSAVLAEHVKLSEGGLTYSCYTDFVKALLHVMQFGKEKMGEKGRQYVVSNYNKTDIKNKLMRIIEEGKS